MTCLIATTANPLLGENPIDNTANPDKMITTADDGGKFFTKCDIEMPNIPEINPINPEIMKFTLNLSENCLAMNVGAISIVVNKTIPID